MADVAPTPFDGAKGNDGFFLGPLYTKPVSRSSLGAEPVGGPTSGPKVSDPLGHLHPKKA